MTPNGFQPQLNLTNIKTIKKRIKKNEGYRNTIYFDQLGHPTIGYGHLVKKKDFFLNGVKYSKKHLNKIFEDDFKRTLSDFKSKYANKNLTNNAQEVLIEMIFQLGIKKTIKFKKFNKFLNEAKPYLAATEMINSRWYLQTPKRVETLIAILLNYKNEKRKR